MVKSVIISIPGVLGKATYKRGIEYIDRGLIMDITLSSCVGIEGVVFHLPNERRVLIPMRRVWEMEYEK
jgi:hypothetical protein